MTLTIDLSPDMEHCLRQQASMHGLKVDDYVLRLLEREVPTKGPTVRSLLALQPEERASLLVAAAERAAPMYAADLALPPNQRELTAFTVLDGEDFQDGDV